MAVHPQSGGRSLSASVPDRCISRPGTRPTCNRLRYMLHVSRSNLVPGDLLTATRRIGRLAPHGPRRPCHVRTTASSVRAVANRKRPDRRLGSHQGRLPDSCTFRQFPNTLLSHRRFPNGLHHHLRCQRILRCASAGYEARRRQHPLERKAPQAPFPLALCFTYATQDVALCSPTMNGSPLDSITVNVPCKEPAITRVPATSIVAESYVLLMRALNLPLSSCRRKSCNPYTECCDACHSSN